MPFNELFGGQVLLPADLTYLALSISADTDLVWPLEQQVGGTNVVADIMDLTASVPGLNIDMPDARLVSPGSAVLFNNVGGQTVTIRDQNNATIISLTSGTTWMIYLRDNSTAAGLWRTFQFGASVSVANAAALAGAGLKAIGSTLNTRIPVSTKNSNYVILDSDRAVALVWTSGVGQFDLPTAGTIGADWYCIVRNSGNGDLSVVPPAGTIDGAASKTFPAGSSGFIVCDGTNFFTVGFGTGSGGGGSGFEFLTINVAGSGDYTLSGAELGKIGYRFTGVLTGTRNIVVPGSTDEYWVDNQTTGAFSLFVKTVAQVPGIEVLQLNRKILYCDGTNVVAAESSTVSFPIPVAQGGTGAINAASARTNLGSGATGDAIFVSANQATAQTALGLGLAIANTFTQTNTFTQVATGSIGTPALLISSTLPALVWNETDGAANNRAWYAAVGSEAFIMGVRDDAAAAAIDWLRVERTANTIDSVNLTATSLQYNGIEIGYKPLLNNAQNGNYTILQSDNGRAVEYGGGGGHTYTMNLSLTDGFNVIVLNSSASNLTLTATTPASFFWYNGGGSFPTGARTLAPGAIVTIWKKPGASQAYLWGTGVL